MFFFSFLSILAEKFKFLYTSGSWQQFISHRKFQSQLDSKCGTSLQKIKVMKQKVDDFPTVPTIKESSELQTGLGGNGCCWEPGFLTVTRTILAALHYYYTCFEPSFSPILYKTGVLRGSENEWFDNSLFNFWARLLYIGNIIGDCFWLIIINDGNKVSKVDQMRQL